MSLAVSEQLLGLNPDVRVRTRSLLEDLGLTTSVDLPDPSAVVEATRSDKKKRSGSTGFVGLRAIGEPVWGVDVPGEVLRRAVEVMVA